MIDNFFAKLDVWLNTGEYSEYIKKQEERYKELDSFLKNFSLKYMDNMPIENYVIGRDNKKSFCYMIENVFHYFGDIRGRTPAYTKYVIYWSKKDNVYKFGDKRTKYRKFFGSSNDEIYSRVKEEIKNIIIASKNNNYKAIAENHLNPQFKNKIAYLYNNNKQIPIYSDNDLNIILTILDIPFNPKEDRAYKREKLFQFYDKHVKAKLKTTSLFVQFIYSWYGYRAYLRNNEIINLNADGYSVVDVDIDSLVTKEKVEAGLKRRKIVFNPGTEESKKITGRKGEEIVIDYLNRHKKNLDIKEIKCWCYGENRDDGKGYDISYTTNDGREVLIEVKATKADLNDEVCFEMSANEYNVMKANLDNYYIYFISNINAGNVIKRILGRDISGEQPTKYKIDFNSKIKSVVPDIK